MYESEFACVYVHTRPVKSEEGTGCPGTGVRDSVGHHVSAGNKAWLPCKSNEWP